MRNSLFEIETNPTRNEKLIKLFSENCSSYPIIQCYKNKLIYNCKYNIEVEKKINEIEKKIIHLEELPWWLEFID